jgi:hypothetical protein
MEDLLKLEHAERFAEEFLKLMPYYISEKMPEKVFFILSQF